MLPTKTQNTRTLPTRAEARAERRRNTPQENQKTRKKTIMGEVHLVNHSILVVEVVEGEAA